MTMIPNKPEDGSKATLDDVKKMEDVATEEKATAQEAEVKLEEITKKRLEQTFNGEGLQEEPAEEPEKSDDTTPEPKKEPKKEPKEEPAEKSDEDGDTTPAEKDAEPEADEKDKDTEPEAKDVDADDGKKKEDEPQLPDAYYRAAIHRGMKPEEITDFFKTNPKLCVRTLGNIYEAVKRSNEEFATLGRAHKEQQQKQQVAPAAKEEVEKPQYKGVDFEALKKTDIDPDAIAIIKAQDQTAKAMFDQLQELKETRSAQTPDQPSGMTYQETQTANREADAVVQQIETFFDSDSLKKYDEFYGDLPKNAIDWNDLSPGQRANRWAVIEMMDNILTGARMLNRDMKIDEALEKAHINVSASVREKVIRDDIKADVVKRSKSLSLKPSGTHHAESTKPQTEQELIDVTAVRLQKVFG